MHLRLEISRECDPSASCASAVLLASHSAALPNHVTTHGGGQPGKQICSMQAVLLSKTSYTTPLQLIPCDCAPDHALPAGPTWHCCVRCWRPHLPASAPLILPGTASTAQQLPIAASSCCLKGCLGTEIQPAAGCYTGSLPTNLISGSQFRESPLQPRLDSPFDPFLGAGSTLGSSTLACTQLITCQPWPCPALQLGCSPHLEQQRE